MRTIPRSLGVTVTLAAALLATSCGQQTADVGAPPPAAPATPATPATPSEPTDTVDPTTEDPTTEDPAWTASGRLVGTYGDVAVIHEGEPGSVEGRLTARDADGTVVWERELAAPAALSNATDVAAVVLPGHRTLRLIWSGTPADGATLAAGAVVDPATGEDVAAGAVEVPDGYTVAEPLSGDQLFLAHASGVDHLLTVAEDGSMTVDDGSDGYDLPADSLMVRHDLFIERVDGLVAVLAPDGPVSAFVDCNAVLPEGRIPDLPGPLRPLSADRDHLWLGYATLDLAGGSVTCVAPRPEVEDDFTALADDGTLAGVDADGAVVLLKDGQLVPVDGPAQARPEGFLGDLLLVGTEAGVQAYPLR